MKKLLTVLLTLLPMVVTAQSFSKEVALWTGIKEGHLYEQIKAVISNGETVVIYAVCDDEIFPYGNLVVVSSGSAVKVKKFVERILELNDQMEVDMVYDDKKSKFYAKKKNDFKGNPRMYVSTDYETIHGYRPEMLRHVLEILDGFIKDPSNPTKVTKHFN